MSCKRKTCIYFKRCLGKRDNDGTGCSDYEYDRNFKNKKVKNKKVKEKKDVWDVVRFTFDWESERYCFCSIHRNYFMDYSFCINHYMLILIIRMEFNKNE